jgi:hypothetical protein
MRETLALSASGEVGDASIRVARSGR